MKNLRPFQIILLGVFGVLFVVGIIFISTYSGILGGKDLPYGPSVEIWGTLSQKAVNTVLLEIEGDDDDFRVVSYTQVDPRRFDSDLVNAIAEGEAPDLVMLPHSALVTHRTKLFPLSYETLSERTFRDRYVDGAEIFMLKDGVYAVPFAVDPMVMYWNRDIFSSSGLALPPATWEELMYTTTPAITKANSDHDIFQSAVALGEYRNITNAKEILSMLMLQSGSTIAEEGERGYQVTIRGGGNSGTSPGDASLAFYTQFSIPGTAVYSWNRALETDKQLFLGGKLGLYFGLASEYGEIVRENPNLNFDVARVPQGGGASTLRNYGVFYGFAIPEQSDNASGAYNAALKLGGAVYSPALASELSMAPTRRALIARGSSDPNENVFFASALIARGWLDPNPSASESVFKEMIEGVTSNRARISTAVQDAVGRLQLLFR